MAAENPAVEMDDLAGPRRARLQPLDHVGIAAVGDEADVLAVGLVGDPEAELRGERAGLRLVDVAEREAQQVELLLRRGIEEIALVAAGIGRAEQTPAAIGEFAADDIMAGRQRIGAELAGEPEQVLELHRAVALDAGDRRLAGEIALGEALDHGVAEAVLVIEHVMGNADLLGDAARIMDVLPGAAGPGAVDGRAMVVELQRHADDVVALALQQGRHNRGIDASRHRRDDARGRGRLGDVEGVAERGHGRRGDPSVKGKWRRLYTGFGAARPAAMGKSCRPARDIRRFLPSKRLLFCANSL